MTFPTAIPPAQRPKSPRSHDDTNTLWERYASVYDRALLGIPAYSELLSRVTFLASDHLASTTVIADVGCGTGNLMTHFLTLPCKKLVGIDKSPSMLAHAFKKLEHNLRDISHPQILLLQSDVLSGLPLIDDSIHVLTCIHMLYALPDIQPALEEFRRVLIPGGIFISANMTTPLSIKTVILPLVKQYGVKQVVKIIISNLKATYLNWLIGKSQHRGSMHYWNELTFRQCIQSFGFVTVHQERAYIGESDVITVGVLQN